MAINFTDFYTKLGKAFHYANVTHTAVGTTIKDEVEDFLQQFTTEALEIKATAEGVAERLTSMQSSAAGFLSSSLTSFGNQFLIETIKADNPQGSNTVSASLAELRQQMIDNSESLDASTPACTPSYDGSNTGDGIIVVSVTRGDGLTNEHIYAESIEGEVTAVAASGTATITLVGEAQEGNRFSHNWPQGSGTSRQITSQIGASGNLITNGNFSAVDTNEADLPSGWIASVATEGTTLKVSEVEVQTVIMSGTPLSGYYVLHWTNAASDQRTTVPLVYNAGQSAVQTALRAITGLEQLTVVTTGTTPNFTHTITFTGVTNPAELTSTETTDSGSIAHATSTAASANVVRGVRSVEFDSNGAELTTIQVPVTLSAAQQYAFSCLMKADVVPAAGVFTVDLVDGIGGTVIADDQSVNNSFTIDATALTTSFVHKTGVFRTPTNPPDTIYLRIRISTAVSSGTSVFLDEAILVQMTSLYTGGISVAAFTGPTKWVVGDKLTLPVTNDRAGAVHEWMNRTYNLRESDILLPTNNAGSETIADTLIG